MRKEQLDVLDNIAKIDHSQGLLLEKPNTSQQQFLHLYAQRYMICNERLHKNIEEVLAYLPSSFAHIALQIDYMSFCLEHRIQLSLDKYPALRILTNWADNFPSMASQRELSMVDAVLPKQSIQVLTTFEEYVFYIDLIAKDLVKILGRALKNEKPNKVSPSQIPRNTGEGFNYLNAEDVLHFLNLSLPKILFNILLPNDMIPTEHHQQFPSFECLYKIPSLQYIIHTQKSYVTVIKTLIELLLSIELKANQQKVLMDVVFRYFYAFHHHKEHNATDLFLRTYNKLTEPARFALTEEFILFFRISRKIGKSKFIDFLIQKSDWLRQITQFVNEKPIGYKKDTLTPFNPLNLFENIVVETGKREMRYFEVLEDYSLFYFRIDVLSMDITIYLWYFGELECTQPTKVLLAQKQKLSGVFTNNLMVSKRGIYAFEFDNSYSWINKKTVKYQNIVLTPVEVQSSHKYNWIGAFYNNIPMNQMAKDKVCIVKKLPLNQQQKPKEAVDISRNGQYYCLKVRRDKKLFEYQTENENRLRDRIKVVSEQSTVQWSIEGQPIADLKTVQEYILSHRIAETIQNKQEQNNRKQASEKQQSP